MGDGAPNGPARPLDVDVDPLVVAGRLGEPVHPVLLDGQPVGGADVPLLAAATCRVSWKTRMGRNLACFWKDRAMTPTSLSPTRSAGAEGALHDHLRRRARPQTIIDLAAETGHALPSPEGR